MVYARSANQGLQDKLRRGEVALGLWVTLESAPISEIAARIGLDWVCIDTEHSGLGLHDITSHLRAINGSLTTGLGRIEGIEQGLIQKVLGMRAKGIVVPRIRTAEEIEQAVRFAKYPPRGSRGMGIERPTFGGSGALDVRRTN